MNCKAPIALSSRLDCGALLRNAPVSKPVTLVAAPRSRKRAAVSSIASLWLVIQFCGESLKELALSSTEEGRGWRRLHNTRRSCCIYRVRYVPCQRYPQHRHLGSKPNQGGKQTFHFCKFQMAYVSKRICITSISCAPYSLIMVFGIDDIIKLKILALSNGSHRCSQWCWILSYNGYHVLKT